MSATVYSSVFAIGGRTVRYGDFTMVYMQGGAFITTPMELTQMQNWARGRMSSGNAARDRTLFVERFETVLARMGCGLSTRGSRPLLARIVKSMIANAVSMEEWSIPHNVNESVEIKPRPPAALPPAGAGITAAAPAANDVVPAIVRPLVPK